MTQTKYEVGQEIKIHGRTFHIVKVKQFYVDRAVVLSRLALTIRKPRGRREYEMIVYENGTFSSIV